MPEKKNEVATRPPPPGTTQLNGGQYKPEQLDPELANLAMARMLVEKSGTPSILTKKQIVRYGIFNALNHVPPKYRQISDEYKDAEGIHPAEYEVISKGNPTGYDSSLRLSVYREVAAQSINEGGKYFEKAWAFLMKPKYVINGMTMGPGMQDEEKKESLAGRFMNWWRGGGKNEQSTNS
jgi:hypothetical protein